MTNASRKAEPICFRPEQTIKIDRGGTSFTLESREYKAPQCVVIMAFDNRPNYVSQHVAQSLTADGGAEEPS